jgi:hypothetical protein
LDEEEKRQQKVAGGSACKPSELGLAAPMRQKRADLIARAAAQAPHDFTAISAF